MTAAVASTASKGEVLQEKSEDGAYSALELVVLLGKKKLSLLEEQKEACKTFLATSAKKGSARVYWSIVEWASSAVNLHPDDEEYWELLVTGQTLLTSVDKRGTQLPAKVGNVIMAALARAVKAGVTPSRLDTCLRLLTGPLHVICSLPALSTIVQEVATRLLQVSSEEVVPLALTLVTTIQCLIDIATPMTPRKRFDACIKTLLLPLCEVRAALVSMKDPMDLLLPLAVVSNQSTDSKPTLQGLGTATVEQTTSLIDQVFRICLFHEESLEEYASNTLAWKDLATLSMKDAKRTKMKETSDDKEQQEDGAKSKTRKEKKTKSEKHVGYTTQLFALLKQFVKDESTSAGAIATIPVLYKLYLEKQEAVNQQVNLTQANLIASQRDGLVAAKSSGSRQAGKRQRESATLSSQVKVFFEFVKCCSSADAGQSGVAHLLRLVIDHSVYDISEHFESFELWFSEMFSLWSTEENQEAHVRAKVASIGLLLELDHRIINPRLNDLVTFSFSGSTTSPVGMFSPRGELLLRLVDTYVRLRQTVVFISALAAAIQRDSNAAFQFFMQQQQLLLSIGKLLAQVPSAQTSGLWLTLEGYVTSPEHGEAALPMSIVMSVFLKHIPVNDLNVVSLASLCGNLFDALETQEDAESTRMLAAQAVILEAVASLSMLCGAWNHSRPDLVDRMRVVDLKQVKRYLSAIENQEGTLNDETLCIFNAACRLALLSIRQSEVGSKDITVLLEIILKRLGPEQEAIILENIGVVSKYTSQKQLVNLWFLVFDKAVGSTLGQVSELGNASFYEVREMRDVLGDAAEKYLLQRPKVRGRALLVLSSVPKGYMTEGAAKTLIHQSLQYLEEAHAPACRMIATALKEFPDLVAAKDGLPSLSDLKSTVFATLNEPSLSVATTAAAGLCSRDLKGLLKFISSVLTSKSRANLLYALLGGLAKGARGKPLVQEKAADIATKVLEMCKELDPSTERRAQLLAFLLFWSEDTLSSTLLELTRETMQAQLLTKPTKALVEAVSLNIRKLNEDDCVMLVIKALQLCKTEASSSETEWVDLATQQLFKRTSATEQLPKLLALLVNEVLTLRTPGLEEHEATFTQGVDAIYTLSLTLPLLLRSGTKFQDMVIETKGKDLVTTLILLGCGSRVLSKEDNVRCLKVVHALLMDCPGLWRSSSMRSIRLVLQGVADMEISDDPSLGLVTVNLLFGALKRQGPKLATKCASLVFHALDRCTRGIVKSVTSSGADLAVQDKAKWNDCLVMLARVCEELVAYKTVFKHYATYWLSNYIRLNRVAPLRLKTRNTLELAAFHWIAICSKHELQQVHGTADASGRDLLRSLRHAYARQKFRGLT